MKRLFQLMIFFLVVVSVQAAERKMIPRYNTITKTWASYPEISIHDIQYCPTESLLVADTLQLTNQTTRWRLQASHYQDSIVVVTGVVVVAPACDAPNHGIIYTAHGWNLLLHDTSGQNSWAGLFVRVGYTSSDYSVDTAQARLDKFANVSIGDIVRITGKVSDFPSASMNSSTQVAPVPGIQIEVIESDRSDLIPPPTVVPISTFYQGAFPGGKVMYSTGEQYEGSLIEIQNVTVNAIVNTGRGTWNMVDAFNNYISDYDISYYWTIGSSETPPILGDPTYVTPPVNGVIDSMKGSIWTASGGENPRGYRITPLFPNDVYYGVSLPTITTQRRYPVIVTPDDTVNIQARIFKIGGGYKISSASLLYSVNNSPTWQEVPMTMILPDSTYEGTIWDIDHNPYPNGTYVKYFLKAIDTAGNSNILANATGGMTNDSSKGFFFYTVKDGPLTIHDVQYTPFKNSRSPYVGGRTTLSGIVTASDSDITINPKSTGSTTAWYIQDGSGPWNGIWVVKDTVYRPTLDSLKLGDSVSVSGSIQENFDVTRIADTTYTIIAHNRPVPAPSLVTTGTFGFRGNGDPVAEQYEGGLMRLVNATVAIDTPTFSDKTEFAIDDGSGQMLVLLNGVNNYSNLESDTTFGKTILHIGDKIDTLTGIGYYSFNRYKYVPRRNNDWAVGDPIKYAKGWNLVSLSRLQIPATGGYEVSKLFPGAASSPYYYNSGYYPSSTITPGVGYWLKFNDSTTIYQMGKQIVHDTIPLVAGWNMIGSSATNIATNSIVAGPLGNHLGTFYEFKQGYSAVTTLKPGKGYWVKSDSAGYLIENIPAFALPKEMPDFSNQNTITFADNHGNAQGLQFMQDDKGRVNLNDYEMPPAFASAQFDARFESGRSLETFGSSLKTAESYGITVNSTDMLTLKWNVMQDGMKYAIEQVVDGKVVKSIPLNGTGSVSGLKAAAGKFVLTVSGSGLPRSYYLSQNYPNPFNPSTKFEFGLPAASHLEIAVYNLLGQKINTLVNEDRAAGIHTIVWNGTAQNGQSVASGVYFVRMMADKFTQVRKIMLLK